MAKKNEGTPLQTLLIGDFKLDGIDILAYTTCIIFEE